MNVFLSYASDDRPLADDLAVRLRTEGHTVFLDRDDLPEGEGFDARIREAIAACDLYVFLISPAAVQSGRYTLTELKFAREQFANPRGHVLPVMIKATAFSEIPAYLRAVTLLQPEGNMVAETVARIDAMAARRQRLRLLRGGLVATLVAAAMVGVGWRMHEGAPEPGCALLLTPAGMVDMNGLALDVTHTGTQAYRLEGSPLPLDLEPAVRKGATWTLLLRARDGSILGERPIKGCPTAPTHIDFGGGHALDLAPR